MLSLQPRLAPWSLKWLTVILLIPSTSPSQILLYPFGHCINSHLLNMERLAAILLTAGHDVTMVVTTEYTGPHIKPHPPGMQYLRFNPPQDVQVVCQFDSLQQYLQTPLTEIYSNFQKSSLQFCEAILKDEPLLMTLKSARFDLAIYDAVDQCSKILADFVDIPFIAFHTHGLDSVMPRNPAYMPSMLTTFSDNMSLWQRTLNTLGYMVQKLIVWNTLKGYEGLKHKYNINTTVHIQNTFDRASLRFVLGDYGLDYVGPVQPSTILLGGNIQTKSYIISPTLQDILTENQEKGIIIFSFGSLVKHYGPDWQELFARALARLPYTVIWKYDGDSPQNLGNNTYLMPWIPQQELLKHPAVQVFVTHCGMNGAFEAAYYGVPIVGIPLFADQFYQASKLTERANMGIKLDIFTLSEEKLYLAIREVAENSIYKQNAQHVSQIMNNRPRPQDEDILFWVSYVINLKGAGHLRSRASSLTWYQYYLLDVSLVLFMFVVVMTGAMWWILKVLSRTLKDTYIKQFKVKS